MPEEGDHCGLPASVMTRKGGNGGGGEQGGRGKRPWLRGLGEDPAWTWAGSQGRRTEESLKNLSIS